MVRWAPVADRQNWHVLCSLPTNRLHIASQSQGTWQNSIFTWVLCLLHMCCGLSGDCQCSAHTTTLFSHCLTSEAYLSSQVTCIKELGVKTASNSTWRLLSESPSLNIVHILWSTLLRCANEMCWIQLLMSLLTDVLLFIWFMKEHFHSSLIHIVEETD